MASEADEDEMMDYIEAVDSLEQSAIL
jgi:hypothetical protein